MRLYEVKLALDIEQTAIIGRQLDLTFVKEYSDKDIFISSSMPGKKEKIKFVGTTIKHYILYYDKAMAAFVIQGHTVSDKKEKAELESRKVERIITRRKEVYMWPVQGIQTAFDFIQGMGSFVFFEIYDQDISKIAVSLDIVRRMGYTTWQTKTYDELIVK